MFSVFQLTVKGIEEVSRALVSLFVMSLRLSFLAYGLWGEILLICFFVYLTNE